MKIKNRKGSTLALTIMIFAVLMIFATFTLGFMVTENKQSIYYQNKTQAYNSAISGVDIIETALVDQMTSYGKDITGINNLLDKYKGDGYNTQLDVNGDPININIRYGKVSPSALNNVLIIEGEATHKNVKQRVKKIVYAVANTISTNSQEIVYEGQGNS